MERPLPCDTECERSFLASIMAPGQEDLAHLCHPLLSERDFVVPLHRDIFRGIGVLLDRKMELSSIALRSAMGKVQGHETDTSLLSAILEVLAADEVGSPAQLADILRQRTQQRRLILIGEGLAREAYGATDPVEVASRATEALRNLDVSRSARVNGLTILDRANRGEAFAEAGAESKLVRWGIGTLDEHIEGAAGHLIVLGARPKCGKSALAVQALCATASRGIPSLLISLEMDQDECQARIAGHLSREGYPAFRAASYSREARESLEDYREALENINVFFAPSGIDLSRIELEVKDAVRSQRVRTIFVDYFQLLGHHIQRNGTEASALGANVSRLKRLAQETRTCIVLLAQINREGAGREGNEPLSSDLKATGSLEQDANAIVLLWRDKSENLHLKISDNRSGPAGFSQIIAFDGANNTFREIMRET